jgi:hypothetical protein
VQLRDLVLCIPLGMGLDRAYFFALKVTGWRDARLYFFATPVRVIHDDNASMANPHSAAQMRAGQPCMLMQKVDHGQIWADVHCLQVHPINVEV